MKKKISLKAEDILPDEKISKTSLTEILSNNKDIDDSDAQLTSRIYFFLTSDQLLFSEAEKEQTKNRITASIRRYKWKRQLIRFSAAAAVIAIMALTGIMYYQVINISEIANYAQALSEIKPDQTTRLILQDGEEIKIEKEKSEINYTQDGKSINIGSDQEVVQEVLQEVSIQKPIFNTVIVPYGKTSLITLCDGTKVWLNSGSKLIYPPVFIGKKREVYIEGEAIFEVTHSKTKPFHVKTRDYDIKVLGTIFNVNAYADEKKSSTVLKQGKVEISYKRNSVLAKEKVVILPGQRIVYDQDKNTITQQTVNTDEFMSWQYGYLAFRSEKMDNILKKLTRYYNIEIILEDVQLQNQTFSGNLDLKNSPEEVLEMIAQTTPFTYKHEDNTFIIIPNNY